MKINDYLRDSVRKLDEAGIATARLDCLVLLEDVLGKDRSYLLAHPETTFQGATLERLNALVERRVNHEPLAYIRGKTEFYGRDFYVSPDTLEPRPETETLITLLRDQVSSDKSQVTRIADIGTGSGCIAITAKLEFPRLDVYATEINAAALKIARQNAKKHHADINFYEGNLLQPLSTFDFRLSTLLCNLPYVPDSHTINEAAMHEPKIAIFGGSDGLDLYRQLYDQIATKSQFDSIKYILTESLPFQHQEHARIAADAGYGLQQTVDFIQVFKRA